MGSGAVRVRVGTGSGGVDRLGYDDRRRICIGYLDAPYPYILKIDDGVLFSEPGMLDTYFYTKLV